MSTKPNIVRRTHPEIGPLWACIRGSLIGMGRTPAEAYRAYKQMIWVYTCADTDSLIDRIAHGATDQDDAEAVRSIIEERDRAAGKQRHVHERHVHKAGPLGDIDTCRRCGRDLRDEIHVRY